ncbi:MAG: hypothetical protein CMM66_02130 [Rhodospirillaceae bacterium]|nr:hypothetical protein [Rhodospirillaceae bacterium]
MGRKERKNRPLYLARLEAAVANVRGIWGKPAYNRHPPEGVSQKFKLLKRLEFWSERKCIGRGSVAVQGLAISEHGTPWLKYVLK